ncbi:MAG: hypothetical protein NZM18_09055 [Thermoflexales bacterium]|nr:hypothetical protein [Thermoflexales bacterium]MDW8351607.1 hypothetical protein [Anaerolineae bacterium]
MDAVQALLGAWTTTASEGAPVWRRELSSDQHARHTAIDGPEPSPASIERVIERLSRFADGWSPTGYSRAKSLGAPARTPEDALANALDDIAAAQAKRLSDPLQTVQEEVVEFFRRMHDLMAHYAVIETVSNGAVVARTMVSWTGDFKSLWRTGLTAEEIRLHKRNVRAALARRAMLIRLMSVIGASAAKIALRLMTPGAQLLVLPALWQFVREVLKEARREETPLS